MRRILPRNLLLLVPGRTCSIYKFPPMPSALRCEEHRIEFADPNTAPGPCQCNQIEEFTPLGFGSFWPIELQDAITGDNIKCWLASSKISNLPNHSS